ncbi:hypothetical protein [Nocardia sp. CC201C]|uniref:hypothetical protein n=1 Tax=Nocardia sp. CC201C TaxID=3044575 RepID=UPI0024A9CDA1|nr:hypothetical protein [Nocardia sp. CC201C]
MSAALPLSIDWTATRGTSCTTLTTHVWTAPPLRRGEPLHDKAFAALRALEADYVRLLPWFSSPKLSVPELYPPVDGHTSWDFAQLDQFMDDCLSATAGRPVVANFATIPTWMFHTAQPVALQDDPAAIHWDYEQGTEFRDPTLTEVADHFERIGRWYLAGGFTDQFGVRHTSGRRHRFAYWEVLCEPDIGHRLSPQVYTRLYDAVVERLRELDPEMKFVGLSLSPVTQDPEYLWHFLDPANHRAGIAVDAVSYHFYATPDILDPTSAERNPPFEEWRGTFFAQAEGFITQVRLIDSIRRKLSPHTKTFINEIGSFAPDVMSTEPDIPQDYWALGGAVIAYLWSRLTELGIDIVGVAEFMDYPGMIAGTSLLDWNTGEPNARYRVLQLLLEHFGPGDELFDTAIGHPMAPEGRLHARAFRTAAGERKVLLVNKYPDPIAVHCTAPDRPRSMAVVDTGTGAGPAAVRDNPGDVLELGPYATAVVTLATTAD